MAIQVQCGACGAKYNVADAMAGKKVRCRQCGAVFGVPGPGAAEAAAPVTAREAGDETESVTDGLEDSGAAAPPPKPAARPAARRPNVLPPVSRMPGAEETDDQEADEEDVEGYALNRAPRYVGFAANPAFQFPGAELIDRFGPLVIGLGILAWMIAKTLRADDSGRPWVGFLRVAIYIGGYAAVVFPLTLWGVHRAGCKARFGMPPSHRWMIFAIFGVPFALGIIFSLTGVGLAPFIIGVLIGLIPALAGLWFHCRLLPQQMVTGLATPAAFFVGGVTLAVLLAVGANWAVQSSVKSSPPQPPFTSSPLGPAFAWEATPAAPRNDGSGTHERSGPLARIDQTAAPTTADSATTGPATQQASTAISTTAASQPSTAVATTQGVEPGAPATQVAIATTMPVRTHETPTTVTPQPQPQPTVSSNSALVASVTTDVPLGEFDSIRFPSSAGGPLMLVIRSRGLVADALEVWSATPPLVKKATLTPSHPRDTRSEYFLAPKGTTVARIVEFPKRAIELRNVADDKWKSIELDAHLGTAEIVGFGVNNQLLVLRDNSGKFGIEDYDLATSQRVRTIDLPGFEKGPGNLAISPDGRFLATAARANGDPAIQVIDISGVRGGFRTYPITALGADKPLNFSAISFTPDASRFCAFYEEADNGLKELFVSFKPPDPKQLQYLIFAERPNPVAVAEYLGRPLDWLPDGVAWLVYGNTVIQGEHVLGDLGFPQAMGHFIVDRETVALVVPSGGGAGPAGGGGGGGGGKLQLVQVKLNLEKLSSLETTRAKP
jgi:predicted Zn finger-like uncharacterized protein